MTRIARWSVIAFGLAVLTGCATHTSQMMIKGSGAATSVNPDFKVNKDVAEAGRIVWVRKSCQGCHTIGEGHGSGPDLFGVVERRPVDWLHSWLKNPSEVIDTDPLGEGLWKQYKKIRMPNLHLSDQDIDAVLNYIQMKTDERRAMANAGSK